MRGGGTLIQIFSLIGERIEDLDSEGDEVLYVSRSDGQSQDHSAVAAIIASALKSSDFPCINRAHSRRIGPSAGTMV